MKEIKENLCRVEYHCDAANYCRCKYGEDENGNHYCMWFDEGHCTNPEAQEDA